MPGVTPYESPQEAASALIRDHAKSLYNIEDADPLKVVAEIMYDRDIAPEIRLRAAATALKYTRTELRSTQVDISGTVNHTHEHQVEEAIQQANKMLDTLKERKFQAGAEDDNVIDLRPESVDQAS